MSSMSYWLNKHSLVDIQQTIKFTESIGGKIRDYHTRNTVALLNQTVQDVFMFYHIAQFIFWIINLFIFSYITNSLWNWLTISFQYHHPQDRLNGDKVCCSVFWRFHVVISPSPNCISPPPDCSSYFSCPKGTAVEPPGSLCAHLWSSPAKTWDERQKQNKLLD